LGRHVASRALTPLSVTRFIGQMPQSLSLI
jgi:hypothetical protein